MGLGAIHNLDYTVIYCTNMETSKDFYRDVLRFPIEIDREKWVNFRIGSSRIALRPHDDTTGTPDALPTSLQLAFRVPPADIDDCHRELIDHGVKIVRGPVELPDWRHRALFFHAPEGTLIEIYSEY